MPKAPAGRRPRGWRAPAPECPGPARRTARPVPRAVAGQSARSPTNRRASHLGILEGEGLEIGDPQPRRSDRARPGGAEDRPGERRPLGAKQREEDRFGPLAPTPARAARSRSRRAARCRRCRNRRACPASMKRVSGVTGDLAPRSASRAYRLQQRPDRSERPRSGRPGHQLEGRPDDGGRVLDQFRQIEAEQRPGGRLAADRQERGVGHQRSLGHERVERRRPGRWL